MVRDTFLRFYDVTRKRAHTHVHRHTKGACTCFTRLNLSQINGGGKARRQLFNIYAQFLFHSLKQISNLGVSHSRVPVILLDDLWMMQGFTKITSRSPRSRVLSCSKSSGHLPLSASKLTSLVIKYVRTHINAMHNL